MVVSNLTYGWLEYNGYVSGGKSGNMHQAFKNKQTNIIPLPGIKSHKVLSNMHKHVCGRAPTAV